MGKIISQTFVTLDGVTQAPGGKDEDTRDGFERGGWSVQFADEVFGENADATFRRADAMLLGRATYEQFAYWWPQRPTEGDPVSTLLNEGPKYVASTTLKQEDLTWQNSHLLQGDTVEAVRRLKEEIDGNLLVAGSVNFLQTLMRHNLVDEYQLVVFPVVVGPGHRLFREALPFSLRLIDSKTTPRGVQIQTYEPGEPQRTVEFDYQEAKG